ncbi:soluble NSF attachment protein 29-like [Hyposmocoma kahamanoa]|uniref:soluble NSF attachment protein 29-like n=1 Tax=Hyposmocoma kahamanoa TaxID=1477025 RepID=UPI000E6D9C83|nr:soluble NSF attachment protein 29-like [Hyposmocoma kahamanoa]
MAGHKYITNSSNLFEDEDVDADMYVNRYRPRIATTQSKPVTTQYDGRIAELERQKQAILERTLDSSDRSICLLRESEDIGAQAAVELNRQREQLETTDKRLDEMNINLNYSQKHLNGIKSVFYGLKNYISGRSNDVRVPNQTSPGKTSSKKDRPSGSGLTDTITNFNNDITPEDRFSTYPSVHLKGLEQQTMAAPISDSQRINTLLDDNLKEMVQHVTRLKGLGVDLGREIDTQNELIDKIQDKVEVVDVKIGKQNKTMNKLLGK